jgi:hypothetical protein
MTAQFDINVPVLFFYSTKSEYVFLPSCVRTQYTIYNIHRHCLFTSWNVLSTIPSPYFNFVFTLKVNNLQIRQVLIRHLITLILCKRFYVKDSSIADEFTNWNIFKIYSIITYNNNKVVAKLTIIIHLKCKKGYSYFPIWCI